MQGNNGKKNPPQTKKKPLKDVFFQHHLRSSTKDQLVRKSIQNHKALGTYNAQTHSSSYIKILKKPLP